jgi:predicted secreted protein
MFGYRLLRQAVATAAIAFSSVLAHSHELEPQFDMVSFETQVSREVPNDQLVAVLAVELHGPDPAALAATANRRMAEALKRVAAVPAVTARSGNYQTFPRFDRNQRIEGWQLSQELRLESADLPAATRLIGKLQEDLVVRSMAMRLSPEARRDAEDALMAEAIAAFHARAELVRGAMKAGGYRMRSLSIGTTGGQPPRPFEARAMSSSAPVAVEAGVSQVIVTASGSIQLR